jgi:hypothetical protein
MESANGLDDVVNISLAYANGSIGVISYYANGTGPCPRKG